MKLPRLASPLLVALLFGAGCSSTPPSSTSDAPRAEAPSPVPVARGSCDHAYYPLKSGSSITYKTISTGPSTSFSMTVVEATQASAKLKYHFEPSFDLDSEIACTNEGIRATSYLDMGSAFSGGKMSAKTISSYGQLLPQDLRVGSVWASGYEVETTTTMPDAVRMGMGSGRSTFHTTNTAMGEVTVTVPAGTFTALKVESKMKIHTVLGARMPPMDSESTTYNYFVRGKGLVKSETTDSRGGSSGMEATSIETP